MKNIILFITIFILSTASSAIATEDSHDHDEALHIDLHDEHNAYAGDKQHREIGVPGYAEHDDDHKGHADVDGDSHAGHGDHEAEAVIKLNAAQIKQAGIETERVEHQARSDAVHAPGIVRFNSYNLADVTTLVESVIHARHVRLGDEVKKGQKLVTLTSSELARAQAGYLRAEAERRKSRLSLHRLKGLEKEKIISLARLQQAQSNDQVSHANLAAAKAALSSYGMNSTAIKQLIKTNQYGQLTLYAPASGTVVADDFRTGQHIAAGTRLLQIADESTVWVELKLSQSQMHGIKAGRSAIISTKDDDQYFHGKVINIHHQLDAVTRTVGVRLEVQNPDDALHPGMFVQAELEAGSGEVALLLPVQAIQRQGSELIVFIEEEPGHFERREVIIGRASMGMAPVIAGIKEGESVVVKGAFILASELAKSGFEVHNH